MSNYRRPVKRDPDGAQMAQDLAKIPTDKLWTMLDANLRAIMSAWEGGMSHRDREQRARLCVAVAKEIRSRGVQLRLQF